MAHEIGSNVLTVGPISVSTLRSFLPNFTVWTARLHSVTRLRCAEAGIPVSCRVTKNLQSDVIRLPVHILRGFPQSFGKMGTLFTPRRPLQCILLVVHPW